MWQVLVFGSVGKLNPYTNKGSAKSNQTANRVKLEKNTTSAWLTLQKIPTIFGLV